MRNMYGLLLLMGVATIAFGDLVRKSIVFDQDTPKVFYCPQEKPRKLDKLVVKARPIEKLCEFHGKPLPKLYESDCYNDVDESEYACQEKKRIMKRIKKLEEAKAEAEAPPTHRQSKNKKVKGKKVKHHRGY
ncbi:uncharacterized protein LOC100906228 [Galendromus occidentalis]|uniref:Uncharacterized protein LOC100906228 n=1 Tax=Galendromus occidentalis TaxID=34638 RepID=A0AAJ6QWI5_9ACAR|nr:uncharacterized protein LOC100906228 [Galendromus occidentalis]